MKKAVEMSINFVVMLALGIAIFSLALAFMAKFRGGTEHVALGLEQVSQNEINSLLGSGKLVGVHPTTLEIRRGGHDTFGVGVLSTVPVGISYTVTAVFVKAVDGDNNEFCTQSTVPGTLAPPDNCGTAGLDPDLWLFTDAGSSAGGGATARYGWSTNPSAVVSQYEKIQMILGIAIPNDARIGVYTYDILAEEGGSQYSQVERIKITVK